MKFQKLIGIIVIFALGLAAGLYIANGSDKNAWGNAASDGVSFASAVGDTIAPPAVEARDSPMDRIPEKAIAVYHDRVILDLQDAQWATFTDTHSMEPVLSKGANALEIVPKSADDIQVGDIVSYKSNFADGTIIHRVVYKGEDEEGTYFIMKGDNLPTSDPGRIRFNQLQRVVVAIIY